MSVKPGLFRKVRTPKRMSRPRSSTNANTGAPYSFTPFRRVPLVLVVCGICIPKDGVQLDTIVHRVFRAFSLVAGCTCLLLVLYGARGTVPTVAPIRFENVAATSGIGFVLENCPTPRKH